MFANTVTINTQWEDLKSALAAAVFSSKVISVAYHVIKNMKTMKLYGRLRKKDSNVEKGSANITYLWLVILMFRERL